MDKYQEMEACIHVPDGLNERVMRAAREGNRRERGRMVFRSAVSFMKPEKNLAVILILSTTS